MEDEVNFDMGAALSDISSSLGYDSQEASDDGDDSLGLGGSGNAIDSDTPVSDTEIGQGSPTAGKVSPAAGKTDPSQEQTASSLSDALEPPKTWRKEAAATWASLPAEAKAEILKREDDIFKGIEVYKADASFGKSLKNALTPYLPTLQQYNIDPATQVQKLMEAHHTLALGSPQQKVAFFQKLAQDYRIDLGQIQPPGEVPYVDPAVRDLQTKLEAVESQLSRAEQRQAAETRQALEKQIETFAQDPANIYFTDVANDMAILLEKGICKTLPEAYERAVWMNPAARDKEVSRRQAEASKKAQEEAAAKAASARKATGANVRTSAKSGSAAAPLGSIDDTLAEAFAAIKSRG